MRDKFITMLERSSENNPFRPGFGAVPEIWAGRDDAIRIHDRERHDRIRGRYTQGVVFIGPSGIGKSVLVNRFAQDSAHWGDVIVDAVRVAKRSDPIAQLAGAIAKARDQLASDTLADVVERSLKRLKVVSIKGVQLAATQEGISNPHLVVRDSLIGLGELLARENFQRQTSKRRVLLIRIDELQNADESQRSAILAALGDVLEHQVPIDTGDGAGSTTLAHLPVLVFLTGLPELLNRSTDVDTFRRRFNTAPLGMLSDADVIDALSEPLPEGITVVPRAAEHMAAIVAGDPYFFQLVGQAAWNASSGPEITPSDVDAADKATYGTRLRLVEATVNDIPAGERAVLEAVYQIASEGLTVSGAEVAELLGKKAPQIAPAAQRLERRAAISRDWGKWRVENRLLRRYLTTGEILP